MKVRADFNDIFCQKSWDLYHPDKRYITTIYIEHAVIIVEDLISVLSKHPIITTLNIDLLRSPMSTHDKKQLFSAIASNTTLIWFEIIHCGIDDHDTSHISAIIKQNHTLENINIDYNFITQKGLQFLLSSLTNNCTLQRLFICDNEIEDNPDLELLQLNSTVHMFLSSYESDCYNEDEGGDYFPLVRRSFILLHRDRIYQMLFCDVLRESPLFDRTVLRHTFQYLIPFSHLVPPCFYSS